jgi:hypothetical protein
MAITFASGCLFFFLSSGVVVFSLSHKKIQQKKVRNKKTNSLFLPDRHVFLLSYTLQWVNRWTSKNLESLDESLKAEINWKIEVFVSGESVESANRFFRLEAVFEIWTVAKLGTLLVVLFILFILANFEGLS